MSRVLGILVGIVILGLGSITFKDSLVGWSNGHSDVGFWWSIITLFLTLGGCSAIVGTYIHTDGNQPIPVVGGIKKSLILFYQGVEKPSGTDDQ